MKINKIHIIAFGGLKNYSLDFSDGFNCIYGENENGKTTILSFIKMMFYGNERGSSQISKNIRKKYTPWDGSPMAGSIEFEESGKRYRLEREFRSSNSTDKVTLTDLDLGERVTVDSTIGEKLFSLSAAAFERSIFIGQFGFPESDAAAESEINTRLSNMVSTGEEKISFEEVNSRLQKARFAIISKGGRAGEYDKKLPLLSEMQGRLSQAKDCAIKYNEGKKEIAAHKAETERLIHEAEELKAHISKEQDIKNASKLKEYLEIKAELDNLKAQFLLDDGTPADEGFLRNIKFCISKIEDSDRKLQAKIKESEIIQKQLDAMLSTPDSDESPENILESISRLQETREAVETKKANAQKRLDDLEETQKNPNNFKKKFNPLLLLFGSLLALLCPVLVLLHISVPGFISGGIGLVLFILSFIFKPNDTKKLGLLKEESESIKETLLSYSEHSEELSEQIFNKKSKLEALKLALNSNSTIIENQKSELEKCVTEINDLKAKKESAEETLFKELSRIGITELSRANAILEKLEESANRQKELKQQLTFISRDLSGISYEEAAKKLEQMGNGEAELSEDFELLKSQYDQLINNITDRKTKEAYAESELKTFLSPKENPETLEKEIKKLVTTLEAQKNFCESADIAMEVLAESFSDLRRNFGSRLETLSAEIFARLTNDKYESIVISKSFGINVQEKDIPLSRETDYLSSGTVDQAYLSLRLAVSKLLSENKTLPLFLDDSLAQYDDNRAKTAIDFLNEYAKDGQIIMFTCHNSICDACKDLNAEIGTL